MKDEASSFPAGREPIPQAKLRPQRRLSLAWVVPIAALILVVWMGWQAWADRGMDISIQFDQAHGLRVGDPIRFRGASVGEVREIALADDLQGLVVTARLERSAQGLARPGTRFWIVRPQVGLDGAAGLDTIVGPRYIATSPSAGGNPSETQAVQRSFVGLTGPPLIDPEHEGDLEIVLYATNRGSLAVGGPLLFRQYRVGTITAVALAADAGSVEARVRVDEKYAPLVRESTRFWDVGGYTARLGWRGLSVEVESFQTFVTGGVAMATPPPNRAGRVVRNGHRFEVAAEPQKAWLDWEPMISLRASAEN